jgi:hypothetical protein
VSWRRSASSRGFGSGADFIWVGAVPTISAIARRILRRCPRGTPMSLRSLIGQIAQDTYVVDPVIVKALDVLGHAERGQPLRDRGHLLPLGSASMAQRRCRATMMMGLGFAIQGDLKADWQAGVGDKGPGNALLCHF